MSELLPNFISINKKIDQRQIADNEITEDKIQDGAVTNSKISSINMEKNQSVQHLSENIE